MSLKYKILELRNNGKSYNEISKILNCSKGTINYHCSKINNNIEIIKKNNLKNKEDETVKLIRHFRSDGKNFEEIKKILNISIDDISFICRKNNIPSSKLKIIDRVNIEKLFSENNSVSKTSKLTGISRYTISNYLNSIGITHRKCNDSQLKKLKSDYIKQWRTKLKEKLVLYKGGKCTICGYNKCIQAMEFHHLIPSEKEFNIGESGYGFEKIKKEVDKCVLLCNRCHVELHNGLIKHFL